MTLESYLMFIAATVVLVIVPGPDMLYMLTRSIAQGRRAGLMAVLGINAGAYVHLAAAVLGLSAILAASSLAFTIVKWAGAAYLIYLGVRALTSRGTLLEPNADELTSGSARAIFWQGFVTDVLNPKVAMFYLALLPQFVDPQASDPTMQLALLGVTFNMVALPINIAMICLATKVTASLRRNRSIAQWLQKAMGTMFIALGLRLASEKV